MSSVNDSMERMGKVKRMLEATAGILVPYADKFMIEKQQNSFRFDV